jgi:hypothetical protein
VLFPGADIGDNMLLGNTVCAKLRFSASCDCLEWGRRQTLDAEWTYTIHSEQQAEKIKQQTAMC